MAPNYPAARANLRRCRLTVARQQNLDGDFITLQLNFRKGLQGIYSPNNPNPTQAVLAVVVVHAQGHDG